LKKKSKIFIGFGMLIIAFIALIVHFNQSFEVEVVKISQSNVTDTFTEEGVIKKGEDVNLISNVSGNVIETYVTENSFISKGNMIVKIDIKDYEYQKSIHQSNIDAYNAQIMDVLNTENNDKKDLAYSINELKAQLDAAQSDYDYVKSIYDTQKKLYDLGAISEIELNTAEDTCIKAKAALDSLQFRIDALQSKLNNDYSGDAVKRLKALIEVENTSINQLDEQIRDCTIVATSSGYITNCPIKNISSVEKGQIVATIKSENLFTVSVDVLTNSVCYLKVGDNVQLTQKLRGEDYVFSGSIKEIYNYATESQSALGLKEHRVKVLVDVLDDKSVLKDGYEIDVKFEIYAEENKISVPNSALFLKDEQNYVFKKQNSKAVLTPVEIGHKTNTETVIDSGLSDNDIIVYNVNAEGLSDGTRISAKK